MGGIMGQSDSELYRQRQEVVNSAVRWHQNGGVVVMTWHAVFPGTASRWENVQRKIKAEEFEQIVTPGTDLHKAWLRDIDQVAKHFKVLRDNKVPVLWRPYHEMNGGWFWWGKQDRFAELWELLFDRFTRYHGLHNLLWVWNPIVPNEWGDDIEPYYPGTDRTDVLAFDIYDGNYQLAYYEMLQQLGEGKPIAIGENGLLPNAATLAAEQNYYVWFMTWGKELERNEKSQILELYANPTILNRNEKWVNDERD